VGDIYLESYQDGARLQNPELDISAWQGLMIIDENQRISTLFNVLRVLADRDAYERGFLILGSAAQSRNGVI
jgi:predicted AAA+ superfamily ATPase